MGVVRAQIQTVEEVYQLVWTAVAPLTSKPSTRGGLDCFVRTGGAVTGQDDFRWRRAGQLRVLCYQYGGESRSGLQPTGSAANWRCVALEKLSGVKLVEDAWRTAPNHSLPASCVAEIDTEDHPERDPQKGH